MLSAGISLLSSCNKFLDELPDDRAEINSTEKVDRLLVTAYPTHDIAFILEYSSDNVDCNGNQYACLPYQESIYKWEDVEETTGNDVPKAQWNAHYTAIATANEALAALDKLEANDANNALRAEALLCRAYSMFQLANLFCMSWNPEKADEYYGLPYPKEAGITVEERGTLRKLFENINADIEAALPMLKDDYLKVPKYHFNAKAAYAFAARFNLYYLNDDKAIEYASKVVGSNPDKQLRQMANYSSLAGRDDVCNAYMRDDANVMITTAYSLLGRAPYWPSTTRYAHNNNLVTYETFRAKMPWGSGGTNNVLYEAKILYGNSQTVYYPKMLEQFEVTDKVNQTGSPHIVNVVFTVDETLLVRAEAYARKGNFDASLADINTWLRVHCRESSGTATRPVMDETSLNSFMDALPEVPAVIKTTKDRGIKKPLHPQGFTVEPGTMTNLIYMILQMRRIETWLQGTRFLDIKRYGIEFSHALDGESPLAFKAGDLRGAIQIPAEVITAGIAPNPREN